MDALPLALRTYCGISSLVLEVGSPQCLSMVSRVAVESISLDPQRNVSSPASALAVLSIRSKVSKAGVYTRLATSVVLHHQSRAAARHVCNDRSATVNLGDGAEIDREREFDRLAFAQPEVFGLDEDAVGAQVF